MPVAWPCLRLAVRQAARFCTQTSALCACKQRAALSGADSGLGVSGAMLLTDGSKAGPDSMCIPVRGNGASQRMTAGCPSLHARETTVLAALRACCQGSAKVLLTSRGDPPHPFVSLCALAAGDPCKQATAGLPASPTLCRSPITTSLRPLATQHNVLCTLDQSGPGPGLQALATIVQLASSCERRQSQSRQHFLKNWAD